MIHSILTSPNIYNITQSTASQVSIETGLKAIGRPGFILIDPNIDKQTKKYSAMKEFLFQLTCFASSMAIVIPVFKKGSFNVARKLFKNEQVFKAFKNSSEFNKFYKLTPEGKIQKLNQINLENGTNYKMEDINQNLAKGMIEGFSILGSILGLSALSPMISRPFVRPLLKKFGVNNNENINLDVKA